MDQVGPVALRYDTWIQGAGCQSRGPLPRRNDSTSRILSLSHIAHQDCTMTTCTPGNLTLSADVQQVKQKPNITVAITKLTMRCLFKLSGRLLLRCYLHRREFFSGSAKLSSFVFPPFLADLPETHPTLISHRRRCLPPLALTEP